MIVDDARAQTYRKDNPRLRQAFLAAVEGGSTVTAEWREHDAESWPLATVALASAQTADLLVVAQKDRDWPQSSYLDIDDALILGSGRPVLVVPNEGLSSLASRRALIAWNQSREATRAVFDALPLLQQAQDVAVLTVAADGADLPSHRTQPDICASLARHGVTCRATQIMEPHADIGRSLTEQAISHGADLLVMGCYGHSRLHEFMLGGASQHQLRHMMIPVLMSH
ncbi:MAG: universal stress protein [Rhodospirillales bacterium]|nr:universal stress protein [Rhodospirillales bacterium]